jgi:NADH-quinone oxidoreductase subunit N
MLPTVSVDALQTDLLVFLPEVVLCVAIVLLLLIRLVTDRLHLGGLALTAVVAALAVNGYLWFDIPGVNGAFAGMLVSDSLTLFVRFVLLGAAALTIGLTLLTGIPDREDSGDFHVLLLGGTLGMLLMAASNHLLMAYIAVEMASLPSYALAGFLKGKRQGSEAALKYVVYGGGASGVMLYGISLVAGRFGTAYLPNLAQSYALAISAQAAAGGVDVILLLGTLLILVGLGFKLSAVPFHFWCPDVFEGAAAEVAAFLSVASKAAAFALTGRLVLALAAPDVAAGVLPRYFGPPLAFLAALTATFGNLAAYPQNNLKRLLAYSTIAHAGYMLMGLATVSVEGAQAVLFYLGTYVFMNLGAFAVVAFVRNRTGSEDLSAYRGLVYRAPGTVVLLAVFLLSLLGIPPLAGFVAKFLVFAAVFHAARDAAVGPTPWLGTVYYTLLVIGGLNTAFSAFYYLRVIKTAVLDKPLDAVEGQEPAPLRMPAPASAYAGLLAAAVVALGVAWNTLAVASEQGVRTFAREPLTVQPSRGLTTRDAAPGKAGQGKAGQGKGGQGKGGQGKGGQGKGGQGKGGQGKAGQQKGGQQKGGLPKAEEAKPAPPKGGPSE